MAESRSINSGKNIFWGYFNILTGLLMSFISRTVFIKTLGIEYLSINGLFSNILTMLSLADLGFGTAMAYSYYKPIAENDTEKISALNGFYKIIYRYIAFGIAGLGILIAPFLRIIINLERPMENLYIYYFLTLAGVVASYLMVYKSTLISAYQKNYVISRYNSMVKCFVTVLQIVFLIATKNYIIYLVIVLAGNLVNNLRISFAADKMFPFIKQKASLQKETKKDIFENIKSVFIYKISGVMINGTDNILISTIVGTIWVGYYSNYLMIINNLVSFINMIFTSLTASVGNVVVKEDGEKQYTVFRSMQIASHWLSIVVVPCVGVLLNSLVRVWLGSQFVLDYASIAAIILNLYLTCILQPVWIFREATGIYRKTKYIMLLTAVLNVVLSVWWGYCFGLSGILFASAAAKICTYIWYEPILLFKTFFMRKPARFFISVCLNALASVMVTALLILGMRFLQIEGWGGLCIKAIVCFMVTNVIYFAYFGRDAAFKNMMKKIKLMIRRK